MFDNPVITMAVFAACAALSFLFSGMESGVMALNRVRIRHAARLGDRRAVALQAFLDHSEDFLWTILVGNTLANFVMFCLALLELESRLRERPMWLGTGFFAGVAVYYVVCELVPKLLFQRHADRLSLMLARPFRVIHAALAPAVAVVAWFAKMLLRWTGGRAFTGRLFAGRDELRLFMQEAAPGLSAEEKRMIGRVLDLQSRRVRHVMTPIASAVSVGEAEPVSRALELSRERNVTRLLVTSAETGRVTGLLSAQELMLLEGLDRGRPARDFVKPALFLKEDHSLESALHRMQRGGERLAVVLDARQAETGVISLQDVLKAIFGEVTL